MPLVEFPNPRRLPSKAALGLIVFLGRAQVLERARECTQSATQQQTYIKDGFNSMQAASKNLSVVKQDGLCPDGHSMWLAGYPLSMSAHQERLFVDEQEVCLRTQGLPASSAAWCVRSWWHVLSSPAC